MFIEEKAQANNPNQQAGSKTGKQAGSPKNQTKQSNKAKEPKTQPKIVIQKQRKMRSKHMKLQQWQGTNNSLVPELILGRVYC